MTRRAVVFDLDGTLIDSLPDIANAANALLAEENLPPLPQDQIAGFVGLGERVFLDRLIAATALREAEYDTLLSRFVAQCTRHTGETRLFAGVPDALTALKDDGFALALCTNKPSGPLAAVLEAVGLDPWFDGVVAGDTLCVRKPAPDPLQHAFALVGATHGVYVGDSETDAETAQRAGVPFLLFSEGIRSKSLTEIPNDEVFNAFSELPGLCRATMRAL
jgi:2-phosphoglycolate phosphatase, prokaryotic